MKKRSLVVLLVIAFFAGTLFSHSASASVSLASLQKQIKSLKAQLASKDKQISDLKKTITKKDKDIKLYKSYAATPSKTNVAFQGNVLGGVYQVGNSSVPVMLEYRGVKYTPVELVGDLLNNKAIFNSSKNTVFFGVQPSGSYMSDILKPYYSTNTVDINKSMTMGGQTYTKGYSMDFSWYGESEYAINLAGKYSHITGILGIDDSSSNSGLDVLIYGDNELIATYKLEKGGLPLNIDFDVSKVKKLEVRSKSDSIYSETIDFANVIIN